MFRTKHRTPRVLALATAYEDQTDEVTIEFPEDPSTLSTEDLDALHTQATEAFDALFGDGEGLSTEDVEALSTLADGIDSLRAEQDRRAAEASERDEQAAALAARVRPGTEGEAPADGEGETPAEGEEGEEFSAEGTEGAEGAEGAEQGGVTASGRTSVTMRNLQARRNRRRQATPPAEKTMRDIVFAGADVPGLSSGQGVDWSDLYGALDRRLRAHNPAPYKNANATGRRMRNQQSLAIIRKPYEETVTERTSDAEMSEILARAADERRLPKGGLVASGGWCAPSETMYDLCELESRDGIVSVPEIGASRGGIRNTTGPSFADIYADTGFSYTEQDAIDGNWDGAGGGSKPCYHIECPPFEDHRLNLDGVCITGGLLQARAYPELTQRILRGALVAHDHRMNANFIAAQVAGSTAVALPTTQAGATAPVLTAIELQVEHMKTVNRMSRTASLEAVFPYWVRGVIRSDLSRRLGVDLLSVSDARISQWFAERGVNAQFVYDWQDIGTTAASGFTAWPTEVEFLLYPAGTWVKAGADVLTLDTVYDSTLLGTNDYTALFSEEGWQAIKTCQDSRVVTTTICPDGATHAGVGIECDGTFTAV